MKCKTALYILRVTLAGRWSPTLPHAPKGQRPKKLHMTAHGVMKVEEMGTKAAIPHSDPHSEILMCSLDRKLNSCILNGHFKSIGTNQHKEGWFEMGVFR